MRALRGQQVHAGGRAPPVPRGRQEDHRKTHFDKAYDFSGAMPGKEAGSADDASWVPGGCHMQCGRGRDGNLQKLAWGARKGRRLLFCQGKPLPGPFGHTKVKLESGPGGEEAEQAAAGNTEISALDPEGL